MSRIKSESSGNGRRGANSESRTSNLGYSQGQMSLIPRFYRVIFRIDFEANSLKSRVLHHDEFLHHT